MPKANIEFGRTDGKRTVKVTPAGGKVGVTQITVTDSTGTATDTFMVEVKAQP